MGNNGEFGDLDTSIGQRLSRAHELVALNEQALADARDQRAAVIIEAIDEHGWTQYRVARALGVSERFVHKVLSAGGPHRLASKVPA